MKKNVNLIDKISIIKYNLVSNQNNYIFYIVG